MINVPEVRLGIVAVSRDCFPIELSKSRKEAVMKACSKKGILIKEIKTTVENEKDVLNALKDLKEAEVNALVLYLGNFGPEGSETMHTVVC
jgi:L-fucose isomerase-like protein